MTLQAGTVLCGYQLIRPLGEGGMGSVWEAEHRHLGRRVAVKIVSAETEKMEELRKRFFQEARAAAKIEHPNVIRILDFQVTDDGDPLLVMELLEGETLEERLIREGTLTLADARALMTQAAAALGAAHAAGILHRDVKADNFFVVRGERLTLKLFDFGIARQRTAPQRITGPLEIFGTPHYMSPEQMLSPDQVDERSDLYSLAVCLYYALTGVLPFSGDTLPAVCVAVARGEMAPASVLRPELPEALDAFFDKALAREKVDRFPNAAAMRDGFIRASNAAFDTLSALERLEGPPRRSMPKWRVAALVALLFASGGATVFARARGAFDRAPPPALALAVTTDLDASQTFGPPPPTAPSAVPAAAAVDASAATDAGTRVDASSIRSVVAPRKRPVASAPTAPIDAASPTVDVVVDVSPTNDDSAPASPL